MKFGFHRFRRQISLNGMRLAISNAKALLREAEILYQANHFQRSFALCVLAMEEAGKVVHLVFLAHPSRKGLIGKELKYFQNAFISHEDKLRFILMNCWRKVLFARGPEIKRLPSRLQIKRGEREALKLYNATKVLFDFLRQKKLKLSAAKLKCIYVDTVSRPRKNFIPPLKITKRINQAILLFATSNIGGAEALMREFKKDHRNTLPDDILTMFNKTYRMSAILDEINSALENQNIC